MGLAIVYPGPVGVGVGSGAGGDCIRGRKLLARAWQAGAGPGDGSDWPRRAHATTGVPGVKR